MKVLRNSPDRFELRFAPWILGGLFAVVIVVLLGVSLRSLFAGNVKDAFVLFLVGPGFVGLAFAFMIRRDDLILDRNAGTMEIRHLTVFGRKTEHFDLDQLEQASTQSHYRSGGGQGGGIGYRVALILKGSHPKDIINVTPVYSGGPGAKDAAEAINKWHKES